MRKIVLGLTAALSVFAMAVPALAQNVTMTISNTFEATINDYDVYCQSVRCPEPPVSILHQTVSEPFTAVPASDKMAVLQVTYGAVIGETPIACRFRAEADRPWGAAFENREPKCTVLVDAAPYSGLRYAGKFGQEMPMCRVIGFEQDPETCDLTVAFEMTR